VVVTAPILAYNKASGESSENFPAEDRSDEAFPSGDRLISLHPDNLISCNQGPLPDNLRLPEPYNIEDFASPQSICAVSLSGGNM
jgi:hypothetical protein